MKAQSDDLAIAQASRERALRWLLDHVGNTGEPADSAERNGWSRLGWSLAVAGRVDVAAAVVSWIGANRIADDGGFRPGKLQGQGYIASYPHYWLGTFVVSAWLAGRTDLAIRSMAYLRSQQDRATGGLPIDGGDDEDGTPICDMLSTAQAGLSAIVTGEHETADRCAQWVRRVAEQTPQNSPVFHSFRKGNALWSEPTPGFAWSALTDFSRPRQAYYNPGMGAVFLARYAGRYGCAASLDAARRLLAYNIGGTDAQFSDLASVQACKFGWAVGEMALVDPDADWLPWLRRMIGWFVERQSPEGWWGPSTFAEPNPSIADRLVKTSEHLMELSVCAAALSAAAAR